MKNNYVLCQEKLHRYCRLCFLYNQSILYKLQVFCIFYFFINFAFSDLQKQFCPECHCHGVVFNIPFQNHWDQNSLNFLVKKGKRKCSGIGEENKCPLTFYTRNRVHQTGLWCCSCDTSSWSLDTDALKYSVFTKMQVPALLQCCGCPVYLCIYLFIFYIFKEHCHNLPGYGGRYI